MKNLSEINHNLDMVTKKYVDDAAAAKVDKVEGKQLSTNDYTNEEKEKLNSLEKYTLPVASDDAIGGIKSGTDITVDGDGNVSINDNSHKHTTENISDLDSYIENKITIPTYDEIEDKPMLNGMVIEGIKISADYGLANAVHYHTIEDIAELNVTVDELNYVDGVTSNIQTQLNNKADTVHTHTVEQITNLSKSSIGLENVENKSSETIRSEITSDNIAAALGYTPAESIHTHVAGDITNLSKTSVGLGNVDNKSSEKIRSEITSANVTDALGFTPMNANLKGAVSGVAELDANGKVPTSQLPSYIDDVLEYTSKTDFPTTGEDGKIYVDLTSNLTYRWGGSAYVEISPSLALGETSATAYRGDKGKIAYDHSQIADGSNPHKTTFANIASKPTTLSGYGITDAKIANGIITLGTNNIAPLTSESTLDATKLVGTASISTTGNAATATTAASLQGVIATATELNYSEGLKNNIQAQLDEKANSIHEHNASEITAGILDTNVLPIATSSTIGAVKVGSNLIVDKNGALDINKYSIPAVGESQEIQTLYGKYLLTTNINSPYVQWKGSSASELSGADRITSSARIKWTVDFNNTSFIIAVDGKPYKIEFGENDFDFSNKNLYLDWQAKIQEKIDQAIGEKIARVMIVSAGNHPVTGGYGINILYAEELTDNYPFLQVFSAEENDTLTLINIASGSAIQLNLNKTIAEYMNTSAESFSYEANGISFSLNTNITLQEFFNIFNENSSSNIIIEYAKNKDAVLITSYTGSLEISDTIGIFDALGLGAGKTELVGHKYLVSLTQPDGTFLENIELKESEFTFDNNLALLQLLQQNNKGTLEYDALENKPTLNGVEISGSMTSEDLGLNSSNVAYGSEEPTGENVVMWIDPNGAEVSVLTTDNTIEYIPAGDYNPATKKYVDDAIANAITVALGGSY